jgi:putative tricarboxylic transport membrane protein
MRLSDGLSGLLMAVLGIAVMWHVSGFPTMPGVYYGPDLFPRIIAVGLIVCGGLCMLRAAGGGARQAFAIAADAPLDTRRGALSGVYLVVSVLSYVVLGERVGFQILTFGILLVAFLWLNGKPLRALALALALTVVFDLMFRVLLRVPIPSGLLEGML